MKSTELFVSELDHEAKSTRSLLERVSAEHCAWKPHLRSWSLGDLSQHIANLPSWIPATLEADELDFEPPGKAAAKSETFQDPARMLSIFDANIAKARAALAAATDADLDRTWTLKKAGAVIFTLPKQCCLRYFVLSHLVHHRGQLTVYLRMRDVPLPNVYGPTADAPM